MNMIYDVTGTGWYLVVLGQYKLVLLVIRWLWVSIGLLCLSILKIMEIWSDVTTAGRQTNERRTREDRPTQPMDQWKAEMSKNLS